MYLGIHTNTQLKEKEPMNLSKEERYMEGAGGRKRKGKKDIILKVKKKLNCLFMCIRITWIPEHRLLLLTPKKTVRSQNQPKTDRV